MQDSSFFSRSAWETFFRPLQDAFLRFREHFFPPFVSESTSIGRLLRLYPQAATWLESRYRLKTDDVTRHPEKTLREFCELWNLPPAQIVFLELQMSRRLAGLRWMRPSDAAKALQTTAAWQILDAREHWETHLAGLPNSVFLNEEVLQQLARGGDRDRPILVFCHFGVRSQDFALKLVEWGYSQVWILQGGIDAWSQTVDPKVPRYEGGWC